MLNQHEDMVTTALDPAKVAGLIVVAAIVALVAIRVVLETK